MEEFYVELMKMLSKIVYIEKLPSDKQNDVNWKSVEQVLSYKVFEMIYFQDCDIMKFFRKCENLYFHISRWEDHQIIFLWIFLIWHLVCVIFYITFTSIFEDFSVFYLLINSAHSTRVAPENTVCSWKNCRPKFLGIFENI